MTENEEAVEVLKDIRRWVKIIGIQESTSVLNEVLSDENNEDREEALRMVYHLTDGDHSNADIAKHIDYSSEFVRQRQNEWADLGLLERHAANQPYSTIISLEEVGIEVPTVPDPEEESEDTKAATPPQTD